MRACDQLHHTSGICLVCVVEVSALVSSWATPICHVILTDRFLVALSLLGFFLDLPFPLPRPLPPLLTADADA